MVLAGYLGPLRVIPTDLDGASLPSTFLVQLLGVRG